MRRRWQDGQVPSGANVQPQDFLREIYSAPDARCLQAEVGYGGLLFELEGRCICVLCEHKRMSLR